MIVKEYPYIDNAGNEHLDLVKIYSDLGVSLTQVETGIQYTYLVIDNINSGYNYVENISELGKMPDSQDVDQFIDNAPRVLLTINGKAIYNK